MPIDSAEYIMEALKQLASQDRVTGMERFAIRGNNIIGVSMPDIRTLAKHIGKSHETALALWASNIHEARILATIVAEPKLFTAELIDDWTNAFNTWDLCDQACSNLFIKTPFAHEKVMQFALSEKEFTRRTAFSLIAYMACHYKKHNNEYFLQYLPLIREYATDDRNFVKKAVNWALRGIGKRNKFLCERCLEEGEYLLSTNNTTANWIAKDAIKELVSKYDGLPN